MICLYSNYFVIFSQLTFVKVDKNSCPIDDSENIAKKKNDKFLLETSKTSPNLGARPKKQNCKHSSFHQSSLEAALELRNASSVEDLTNHAQYEVAQRIDRKLSFCAAAYAGDKTSSNIPQKLFQSSRTEDDSNHTPTTDSK